MRAEAQVVPRSTQARLDSGAAPNIKYFRELIEQKKAETKSRITQIRLKLAGSTQVFGLTHAADFNPPIDQADRWALANASKIILRSDEALRRIDLDVYGICFTCDQPIDPRRLQVVPHTRFCVGCKNNGADD